MTLLLILAACDRSPSPDDESVETSNHASEADLEGEVLQVSRHARPPLVFRRYFYDADADGFGAPGSGLWANRRPEGYSRLAGDCNDADATVNPDATEVEADGVDNNCDGTTDESGDTGTDTGDTGTDADGDGYTTDDCNDADATIHPGAGETCDGSEVDEDCDGLVNDDDPDMVAPFAGYYDDDGDGYGGAYAGMYCVTPAGVIGDSSDCDDTDATVNPAATETSNGVDDNCDGTVDEGLGIVVTRDTSAGLTYPATLHAWYGSATYASASVASESESLVFSPTDAELSNHSWVDIQASWDSSASWSDDCDGFSVSSTDYTVALYENSASTGTSDTCRIYVGLAVPTGSDVSAWTLVP